MLTMHNLLAQIPVSPDATDPGEWSFLIREAGPVLGTAIVFMVVGLVLAIGLGFILYRVFGWLFGENGWLKPIVIDAVDTFKSCMADINKHSATMASTLQSHTTDCDRKHADGGPGNVIDLRLAGHEAAEALRAMAKGTPNEAAVGLRADGIHVALRGVAREAPHTGTVTVSQTPSLATEQA